ncbi:DNA gyrase subunit A [Bosea sp. RAC05]|uniref:DNA gyrase subunit A n=1 Tax=Bosea sp. RAC05 TaxID=1842539 RepID=UPI00083CCB46|nr:DNA gyrase subunit A [Bosea sp. RAC05]AOG03362.1 DNA gyrase, A subunit [Bosea sp. RAC05]
MTEQSAPPSGGDRIEIADISKIFSQDYLDYAMSVIVSRALPDVRDGLKPVHRRIMYGMETGGYDANKPYKKSARIVGDVMGKYHPHGDQAIYFALVRLAQDFKVRHPLIDGQGNFGSMDGDPPAAMRYTESRMTRLAHFLTADIDKSTVDFKPNYDGKEKEPVVLPARFPNLLVNGQMGIAVGMAANIPTHNLGEVIDACLIVLDNEHATLDDLMQVMPGPDFPTAGIIMGRSGIRQAYLTGRGSIMMSGIAVIEEGKRGRNRIVITELPYDVNKTFLVEKIAEYVNMVAKAKVDDASVSQYRPFGGISDIRDESNQESMRVVIDLKPDAEPAVVLNALRKYTDFQSTFGYNATCLNSKGQPNEMGLQQILTEFVAFRRECVTKRTIHELDEARGRQLKQIALYAAMDRIDQIIALIRSAEDDDEAASKLMQIDFAITEELATLIRDADPDAAPAATFRLSLPQANAILAVSLKQLSRMGRDKIANELRTIAATIRGLLPILSDRRVLDNVIRMEFMEIRDKHANKRLTRIETTEADEIDNEALIERRDVVVTLTSSGYVKRTELSAYRAQRRGGKGKTGMETKDDDFVISTSVCTTRTPLLAFTAKGHVYAIKAHRLPDANANAKGRPIVNFIELKPGDSVRSLVPLPEDRASLDNLNLLFVTDFGDVRRSRATDFSDLRRGGKIAMRLENEDGSSIGKIVSVLVARDDEDILLATASGQVIRFPIEDLRIIASNLSTGVRGISFKGKDGKDFVVDACILAHTDANWIERDLYLAKGTLFLKKGDLVNEQGESRITDNVTVEDAPEADKPDRVKVTLSVPRMAEMAAEERFLLTISALGYGKRTSSHEYRVTGRSGSGIVGAVINEGTGDLVTCLPVNDDDGLVIVTDGGQAIRTRVSDISSLGRATKGVRVFSLPEGQKVSGVARIASDDGAEEGLEDDGTPSSPLPAASPALSTDIANEEPSE